MPKPLPASFVFLACLLAAFGAGAGGIRPGVSHSFSYNPMDDEQNLAPETRVPGRGDCGAQAAGFALGHRASRGLIAEIRHRSGAASIRVIGAGEGVTRDFRPKRLNLQLDLLNRISGVRCG